jgi:FdhD protein
MSQLPLYIQRKILKYDEGVIENKEAAVVMEKPLTVFLNHNELATLICSPGGLQELTAGFLLSEGLIQKRSDIEDIYCQENEGLLYINTAFPVRQTDNFLRRHIASCCGKGRAGLYFINDARQLQPVVSDWRIQDKRVIFLMDEFEKKADTFRLTGGVHSAALADQSGIIMQYEDIGRHNAVDKILGCAFLNNISTEDKCLLLSGRVASEILIKAARGSIAVILSRAAPTGLTLELAEELGICVVGFARGKQFSVYTHSEKIIFG